MQTLLWLLVTVIDLYVFLLIASIILSWLVFFNVINTRNQFVYMIGDFLHKITEPLLRPIRNVIPVVGGFDLSPIVLFFGLYLVKGLLIEYWPR